MLEMKKGDWYKQEQRQSEKSVINSPFCSDLPQYSWQTLAQCLITSMHKLMHSLSHIFNPPKRKSSTVLPFPSRQGQFHDFLLSLTPTLILKSSMYMLQTINAMEIFKCPPH